jgi:HEPN domain-containing protein
LKTTHMASSMLQQAGLRLKAAAMSVKWKGYAYAVRSSQECVELSLKAALRLVGVEYPKKHDVSRVLPLARRRFPDWFKVEEFAKISRALAEMREPAMYGDELRFVPSTELFTKQHAAKALAEANEVYKACSRLLKEISAK